MPFPNGGALFISKTQVSYCQCSEWKIKCTYLSAEMCTLFCPDLTKTVMRVLVLLFVSVDDIWKKFVPQPVEIKQGSVYDYYDILEELGR